MERSVGPLPMAVHTLAELQDQVELTLDGEIRLCRPMRLFTPCCIPSPCVARNGCCSHIYVTVYETVPTATHASMAGR